MIIPSYFRSINNRSKRKKIILCFIIQNYQVFNKIREAENSQMKKKLSAKEICIKTIIMKLLSLNITQVRTLTIN